MFTIHRSCRKQSVIGNGPSASALELTVRDHDVRGRPRSGFRGTSSRNPVRTTISYVSITDNVIWKDSG
jgi:hypothetical protein